MNLKRAIHLGHELIRDFRRVGRRRSRAAESALEFAEAVELLIHLAEDRQIAGQFETVLAEQKSA